MPLISPPPVIGHRCAQAFAPENTLAGLNRAVALRDAWLEPSSSPGSWTVAPPQAPMWVEVDVQLTADGVPILLHDSTLERTTDGSGLISEIEWAEVRRLDAGRHFDAVFSGERIPSLEAFLESALQFGVGVNLELKATTDNAEYLTTATLKIAQAVWRSDSSPSPPFLSSFIPDALATAARLAPDWPRGLLLDRIEPGWADSACRVKAVAIVVDHRLLTSPDDVTTLGVDDRAVLAYTVNDPARAAELRRWGVASIMTDRPDAEMAAAMAVKIRLAENNFIYGSMVTSCDGRGHNKHHGVTGSALPVTHSMIGRVP